MTREYGDSEDLAVMWKNLDKLYLPKTLPNKIYLLKQFFSFKMDSSKELQDNLSNIFNKLILDLASCNIKFLDEQLVVILLNSLPDSFDSLINAIEYESDSLTKEVVVNAIRAHDFKHKMKDENGGEGPFVRGRPQMKSDKYSNGNENYKGKPKGRR